MEDVAKWINPVYAIIVWVVMLLLIKPKRIWELAPIGILASMLIFVGQQSLFSLNLLRYNKGLIILAGIPLFQYFWAFAFGIIMINYMQQEWHKKLPIIALFAIISVLHGYIASTIGNLSYLNGFNVLYDLGLTFLVFSFGVWIAEGMFKERIYSKERLG